MLIERIELGSDMARCQDRVGLRPSLPPNYRTEFPGALELATLDFEQDTEVPSLPEAIEALLEIFPVRRQIMYGCEAAPLGKSGANYMRVIGIPPVGKSKHDRLVINYAAAVL